MPRSVCWTPLLLPDGAKPVPASLLQKKGVRSKRHMKVILQDLRQRGWVVTKPGAVATAKKDKAFRYQLSEKTLTSPRYKGPQPAST